MLNDQGKSLLDSLVASVTAEKSAIENVRYQQDLLNICERINGVCHIENYISSFHCAFLKFFVLHSEKALMCALL